MAVTMNPADEREDCEELRVIAAAAAAVGWVVVDEVEVEEVEAEVGVDEETGVVVGGWVEDDEEEDEEADDVVLASPSSPPPNRFDSPYVRSATSSIATAALATSVDDDDCLHLFSTI